MKKTVLTFLFISILLMNVVYAKNSVTANDYLDQCSARIGDIKEISIGTMDNRSIKAEFIGFIDDSLLYFDILSQCEKKIPLIEVRYIVDKYNKSVFNGIYYIRNFHKDYSKDNEKVDESISKDMEYNRRSTVALEKIARAQTYFMVTSILGYVLTLVFFIISLG